MDIKHFLLNLGFNKTQTKKVDGFKVKQTIFLNKFADSYENLIRDKYIMEVFSNQSHILIDDSNYYLIWDVLEYIYKHISSDLRDFCLCTNLDVFNENLWESLILIPVDFCYLETWNKEIEGLKKFGKTGFAVWDDEMFELSKKWNNLEIITYHYENPPTTKTKYIFLKGEEFITEINIYLSLYNKLIEEVKNIQDSKLKEFLLVNLSLGARLSLDWDKIYSQDKDNE